MNSGGAGSNPPLNIVGAGLAGALLAVMLSRRNHSHIQLWDRRPDPRRSSAERGRSINLALAARGIRALERAGVMDSVRPLMIPMRGRMIHERSGSSALQPYGQRPDEVIYSVSRRDLNRVLIEAAANHPAVTLRFNQICLTADIGANELRFRDAVSGTHSAAALAPTIATDGAGSVVRTSLNRAGLLRTREEWLDHDYKELLIPAVAGRYALDPHALHIWPRGGFMLIALPNTDQSFTATLFLPKRTFATLNDPSALMAFCNEQFPDAVSLIPDLSAQFHSNPTGQLGTVYTQPWHIDARLLLLGDAAHAIVPFHGQGMNAAFEDCALLDSLMDRAADWETRFSELERQRRPDTDAIAAMALENYTEMRDTVLDAGFVRRKALALELERRFPDRFIPRYSMVMFHPEIRYSDAMNRGIVQEQILLELDQAGAADYTRAAKLISERLPPLAPA